MRPLLSVLVVVIRRPESAEELLWRVPGVPEALVVETVVGFVLRIIVLYSFQSNSSFLAISLIWRDIFPMQAMIFSKKI
jgi:hypothetical protein